VEILKGVDIPCGPDVELPVGAVGPADERRVDAGVFGGLDIRFVVADEQRGVGVEIRPRALKVVGIWLSEIETFDGCLSAVGRLEEPPDLKNCSNVSSVAERSTANRVRPTRTPSLSNTTVS